MKNRVLFAVPPTLVILFLTGLATLKPAATSVGGGPAQDIGLAKMQKANVEGHRVCFDCHRTEVAAWQHSAHSSKVFEFLRTEAAEDYAKAMGIRPSDITTSSMCIDCHGTPRVDNFGRAKPLAGVSCEACHNPSGGADGWLNAHAVYGPPGTARQHETDEHYTLRADRCRQAGQIRSSDLYEMIKRCYACHLVSDEALVNKARHHLFDTGFEPLKDMLGDVRHNFHTDQGHNALLSTLWTSDSRHEGHSEENRKRMVYVVGQIVGAEVVLRSVATAKEPDENYASGLFDLFLDNYVDNLIEMECLSDLEDELDDLATKIDEGEVELDNAAPLIALADKLAAKAKSISAGNGSELQDVGLPSISQEHLDKAYQR